MKRKLISLLSAAVLLSSAALPTAAMAKSDKGKGHGEGHGEGYMKLKGLENALRHVSNERARAAIEAALARYYAHREWDDDWDDDCDDGAYLTAAQIVAADKTALQIDFGGSDTANSVTMPLDRLPSKGANGSTIIWTSSNPSILSGDGKTLNRPSGYDVNITMTAAISFRGVTDTRTFLLTVKQQMSGAQTVAADKAALTITFSEGDSASTVTRPLTLPVTGIYGSSVRWVSAAPSIISNDGKIVNRPAAGSGDATVVMTAILTSNGYSDVKQFTLTVKQMFTDAQKVAADKAALSITFSANDSSNSVTKPITLPSKGINGSAVTWYSSNPSVISADGKTVNRPAAGQGDTNVVLTAILTYNGISDTKQFSLIVKQQLTDAQKVGADKAALTITFGGSDTANSVTGPVILPTEGVNGSSIVWVSNDPGVISNNGRIVVRPAAGSADVTVTLTAVIMYNGLSDVRTFTLTVRHW